ncbi:MAG: hypothetical protein II572_00850 [Clostridia bacterium]|nr:hypothetical protein [Clostridia bacterium]MBQ1663425.1 hypothetical protein [Clostridia bacterium]MBQ2566964.1 hypothetical protein [Clostridia bacterium]MBQ3996357.1 hypothetical protein [Clostridia bacterium]MBQ5480982.1 hypothetical protein [Clostridia bacterium]
MEKNLKWYALAAAILAFALMVLLILSMHDTAGNVWASLSIGLSIAIATLSGSVAFRLFKER